MGDVSKKKTNYGSIDARKILALYHDVHVELFVVNDESLVVARPDVVLVPHKELHNLIARIHLPKTSWEAGAPDPPHSF